MLKLPPIGHAVRELFDVAHLDEICAPLVRDQLPTIAAASETAKASLAQSAAAKSVAFFCRDAETGDVLLVQFARDTDPATLWNFGQ